MAIYKHSMRVALEEDMYIVGLPILYTIYLFYLKPVHGNRI